MSKYLVGAYPASPAHRNWSADLEETFFNLLTLDDRITSLEIPWLGSIHPHDDQWLIKTFPNKWKAVITSIPFVMGQISKNDKYGLASPDSEGRKAAVSDLQDVLNAISRFNDAQCRSVVSAIEIHSAPRRIANKEALAKSLEDIASWDWQGAKLVIEHCDAYVPNQNPEKGFLTLEDEIAAIDLSGAPVSLFINWGRSAIELRDPNRVVEHIVFAKDSGHLSGLIFSGASEVEGLFGYPWIDAHHPFKKSQKHPFGDSDSLLTEPLAHLALSAAGELPWRGIKMGWPPNVEGSLNDRVSMISSALDVIDGSAAK